MKKVIIGLVILLGSLAALYFIRYNTGVCLCKSIPEGAIAAVHLNIRNIEHEIIVNTLFNEPASSEISQVDSAGNTGSLEAFGFGDLLRLPKGIVLFSQDDKLSKWLSSPFTISPDKLSAFAKNKNIASLKIDDKTIYRFGFWRLIEQNGKARIAIGSSEETDLLDWVRPGTTYKACNDSIFAFLSDKSSFLTSTGPDGFKIKTMFTDHGILSEGSVAEGLFINTESITSDSALSTLSVKFDKSTLKSYDYWKKLMNRPQVIGLDTEQLWNAWDGSLHMEIAPFTRNTDTIISYEYDDDFNKIETKKIESVVEPSFCLQLGMLENLHAAVDTSDLLRIEGSDTLLNSVPIIRTQINTGNDRLILFTDMKPLISNNLSNKARFFFDINKYQQQSAKTIYALPTIFHKLNSIQGQIELDNSFSILVE